jgi:hypothetical protein
MNKLPLITDVKVIDVLKLEIGWNTGEVLQLNLTELIKSSDTFRVLESIDMLSQVKVEKWGHGLDWPNGLDMGADRLYHLCREQAGLFSPIVFDDWIKSNRLSLTTAADALGMTRRMISHYRSGSRPIPKTVQLACIGWEALKKAA